MSSIEKLNNIQHADIRIDTGHSAELGDSVMFVPVFPNEMRGLQSCYPLLIYKDPGEGVFHAIALFGFEEGENLFLHNGGWQAPYLPLMVQRGPLMIGFEEGDSSGEQQPVVAIDTQHPRVSVSDGKRLFLDEGGNSDYLDRLTAVLEAIHMGHEQSRQFMALLEELELITSCDFKITLEDGSGNTLSGFYMLDDEKLQALSPESLLKLSSSGFLLPAFMMLASQSQLASLISLKNRRLGLIPATE